MTRCNYKLCEYFICLYYKQFKQRRQQYFRYYYHYNTDIHFNLEMKQLHYWHKFVTPPPPKKSLYLPYRCFITSAAFHNMLVHPSLQVYHCLTDSTVDHGHSALRWWRVRRGQLPGLNGWRDIAHCWCYFFSWNRKYVLHHQTCLGFYWKIKS